MITRSYSADDFNWSFALMVEAWVGPSKLPLAELELAAAIAVRTCSRSMPSAASALGFTWMRTAGRCPPEMLTSPTPDTWEIFCASRVSTRSSIFGSDIESDVIDSVMIGVSAGLTLLYVGGFGRSRGRKLEPALIAACTSCSATSSAISRLNCRVITEEPPELVEVIWLRPDIWPNCFSSGAVTAEVITSGLAPG